MSEVQYGLSHEDIKKIRLIFLTMGSKYPKFFDDVYKSDAYSGYGYEYHVSSPVRGLFTSCVGVELKQDPNFVENSGYKEMARRLVQSGESKDKVISDMVRYYKKLNDENHNVFSINFVNAMIAKGYKLWIGNAPMYIKDFLTWVMFTGTLKEGSTDCPYFQKGTERIYLSDVVVLYSYDGVPLEVVYGDNEDVLYSIYPESYVRVAKAIKLELGLDDVVDIQISPYILALSEGLALSLLSGEVVGDTKVDNGMKLYLGIEQAQGKCAKELYRVFPRLGNSEGWSKPMGIDGSIVSLREELVNSAQHITLFHLKQDYTRGVEVAPHEGMGGLSRRHYSLDNDLHNRLLMAIVDSYGSNIKEAYFVVNPDSDYFLREVMAFKNPADGELTLLFY